MKLEALFKTAVNECTSQLRHTKLQTSFEGCVQLVPLESMACGTPVVSSFCSGVSEYLVNDVNGLAVPVVRPLRIIWRKQILFWGKKMFVISWLKEDLRLLNSARPAVLQIGRNIGYFIFIERIIQQSDSDIVLKCIT